MAQTVFQAGLEQISAGVMPGVDESKVPLWVVANNVICDQYGVRPSPGYGVFSLTSHLFDAQPGLFDSTSGNFDDASGVLEVSINLGSAIRGIIQQRRTNGQRVICAGTLNRLYVYEGTLQDKSAPGGYTGLEDGAPGNPATYWSMTTWGDWIIATNGKEKPQVYKTTGTFAPLGDLQCDWAELCFVLGPHLVLANTSNGQNVVEWSAQGDPDKWNFSTHVTAGRRVIRTFEGPIVAAVPLGDSVMLYGETQAHVMSYGGPFTFVTIPAVKNVGAVSKNSVIPVDALNYGILPEGIFATDGRDVRWVSYPQLGRWLADNVDWSQRSKIAGWYDPEGRVLRWYLPQVSGAGTVLVCNLAANGAFTFESVLFSVGSSRGPAGWSLIGTHSGQVLAQRWDVAKPNRLLETKPIDLGSRDLRKFLDAIRVFSKGTSFRVYIGFSERISGPVDWEYLGNISDEVENTFYFFRDTMYARIRFECNDPNAAWQISGFELLGRASGRRH